MTRPLSRRAWLGAATALGLGAAVSAAGIPLIGRRQIVSAASATTRPARTVDLEARETTWELAPGRTVKALAYNGRVPGPEIRVREGERLRIVFKNALAEPTTIHWHGVDVPNAMDGVPGITQEPVQPGETFVYEFEARPAGTRWYHTHVDEHRQMDLGLAAPLIIEPAEQEPLAYDREVTLVLDDWTTGQGAPLPPTREGTAAARGSMGGMMGGMMRGGAGGMMGGRGMGTMMGRGMGGMMGGGMMGGGDAPTHDTMTINGHAYPATEPLRVKRGERVRLRLINASNEHTHVLRLAGHHLRVTHTDGNALRAPVEIDAIPLAPGERYDAVVTADHPGAWFLACTQPRHAEAGERMLVVYEGHERREPRMPESEAVSTGVWHYALGHGQDILPAAPGAPRTFDLTLSGGMMGSDRWTINRKIYPDTDALALTRGDLARVRFMNMSPEAHPMHLHGQSFRVVAVNGARLPEPIIKDVVDVEAHMGSVVLEFPAHNPGDWFFHCHKPMHMMGGMISLVRIR